MKSKSKTTKKHGGRYASKRKTHITPRSKTKSMSRSRRHNLRRVINPHNPNNIISPSNNATNGRPGELLDPNNLF